jgi:Arc/MetJ-type ribon-helix-helix transcriptional regulator
MRNIVNISLPESTVREIEKEVKSEGFGSKSEFFRHVLREHKLVRDLERDRKDFEQGKGKELKFLRDLR